MAGVILAAGRSRRFGNAERPKLLLEIEGEPLVRRVTQAALASRLGQVVVILGHASHQVIQALDGLGVETLRNADHAAGQSTSVRAGLARIEPAARAAMFLPADQPLVSSCLIDRLIAAYGETGRPIVRPVAAGRRGAPVLWDRTLFPELAELVGDSGGRQILPRHSDAILEVEVDDPLELVDIDTLDDYRRLAEKLGTRPP